MSLYCIYKFKGVKINKCKKTYGKRPTKVRGLKKRQLRLRGLFFYFQKEVLRKLFQERNKRKFQTLLSTVYKLSKIGFCIEYALLFQCENELIFYY